MLIVAALTLPLGWADATDDDYYIPAYSNSYDPGRDPVVDGKEALRYAQHTNRRILIAAGGDWCNYCKVLDRFITDNPSVKNSLYERFVVLKVNVSDENDNEAFMSALPDTFGYPHIFISENDGTVIYSDDTTGFLDSGEYSADRFIDFLYKWGSSALTEDL